AGFDGDTSLAADVSVSCPTTAGPGSSVVPEGVCQNIQDGSNRATNTQTSSASTGDGVAGQVIGVVTSAGGSASIVADNLSQDSSVDTGDADSSNHSAAFVGLDGGFNGDTTLTADVSASCPTS